DCRPPADAMRIMPPSKAGSLPRRSPGWRDGRPRPAAGIWHRKRFFAAGFTRVIVAACGAVRHNRYKTAFLTGLGRSMWEPDGQADRIPRGRTARPRLRKAGGAQAQLEGIHAPAARAGIA